nr:phosphatase PAP2 family protein [Candidatus Sigynarchaeota archaeon]
MEEPIIIDDESVPTPKVQAPKAERKASGKKKAKISGIAIIYLIVLAIFVVGVLICSVGTLDYDITMYFYGLGQSDPAWHQFGLFFNPYTILPLESGDTGVVFAWEHQAFGQMFWEIPTIIGGLMVIVPAFAYPLEVKKAKQENRKIIMPGSMKYLRYGLLILVAALAIALGLVQLIKHIWGRWRPEYLAIVSPGDPYSAFTPWFIIPQNPSIGDFNESFFSGHTAAAVITTGVAFAFAGSRKKALSIVFAIVSVFYTVCVALSRMVLGKHFFSDVLFGGFISFTFIVFEYYCLWDIPGQEKVHRYKLTYTPFNEGYKLILEGKALLKDNVDEGKQKVSAGLEKLAKARANAEDITSHGHDCSALITRIDDVVGRVGVLLQEPSVDIKKWSYFC